MGIIFLITYFSDEDQFWMQRALQLANQAKAMNEVPIGAVIVHQQKIIGEGYNQSIAMHDPTAHAEIIALRSAGLNLQNYRLIEATMYVTLEPCLMCAGAIVHARLKKLFFGANDLRSGMIVSKDKLLEKDFLNHRASFTGGLLSEDCSKILTAFFKSKRNKR